MMESEKILSLAREIAEGWLWKTETEQPEPNRLDIRLTTVSDLIPIVAMLRVQRLGYLSAITGLDIGGDPAELEVLYHFCTGPVTLTLRVRLPREGAFVPSLTGIIPSAEAFERELREMFGVEVTGLKSPNLLYLPDDWPVDVYPLRKDFDVLVQSVSGTLDNLKHNPEQV